MFDLTSDQIETVSRWKCFDGTVGVYRHESDAVNGEMTFSVYLPPAGDERPVPALWFLSGLTCTWENFVTKAGAQRHAAREDVALIVPDTSPRDAGIEGEDEDWDFGTGAGFYLDATEPPWSNHYRMETYVTDELRTLVNRNFPIDSSRHGITGHSMGGHGALVLGLKYPDLYGSISALAPIAAPIRSPWGTKAFTKYLGPDQSDWKQYDATELVQSGTTRSGTILIDQGTADSFLDEQLKPWLFEEACEASEQDLTLRMQEGYDHSYYFVATFIGDHIRHHAGRL